MTEPQSDAERPEPHTETAASDTPSPSSTDESKTVPATESSADDSAKRTTSPKVRIGSQRDTADVSLKPSQPKAVRQAIENPILREGEEVEPVAEAVIGSMEGLGDDVEQEIESILQDISVDDALSGASTQSADELEVDARLKGTVSRLHGDHIFFDLTGQNQGVCSRRQFKEVPAAGAVMDVVITGFNRDEGLYEVRVPGASVDVGDWSDLNEGAVVEVRVSGSNTGGLECAINNIRGFIPASQIELFRVDQLGDYVNQKLQCVVVEVNPERKKLVLSRRALLEREREAQREQLLESIQVGDSREGVVTKLMDFGAFVDIGGLEGLVHISKLSWDRVTHPKEILQEGQKVTVKVEKITEGGSKISLSYRDTLENPWENILSKYPTNAVVEGTVTRIAQFGAFVKLEPGVEGLIHISELAHHRVFAVKNVVKEGDRVEVKVLSVDPDSQKIGLSLKATQAKPEPAKTSRDDEEAADEAARPLAVARRAEPLKGGTERKSGGEDIGLNW